MSQHSDDQPAAVDGDDVDVSYAQVAAEDADESVAREAEALDGPGGEGGLDEAEQESSNDDPPEQPTISTMMGVGPVGEGDDVSI